MAFPKPHGYRFAKIVQAAPYRVRSFTQDKGGSATVEMAIATLLIAFAVMNVTDISIYTYTRMQVQKAAQMGAHAAYATCDTSHLPATTQCSDMSDAVTTGVQSTALGTRVSLISGSPAEGYYCVSSSNALQYMSSYTTKPSDCSAAGMASLQPGDYLKVQTTYTYTPVFGSSVTVGSLLNSTVTGTALIRLK